MITMPRRPALNAPVTIGEIIEKVMKRKKLPFSREDRALKNIWGQVVGETVALQTSPERLERGVLYVRVASSAWLQQLNFLKEEIISRFNEVSGLAPIGEIRFRLGNIKQERWEEGGIDPLYSLKALLTPRDRRVVEASLAEIKDLELREILRRVMEKEIGRRRLMAKRSGR